MKLFQVRKGQFVYFNNELHRVYGVKPMYKKSVHLIRLKDLTQHLTNAASVDRYKPKVLDSFVFNHKGYTLRNDRKAEVGDYILINNPIPDSLDTYSLNEIELVETVDRKGVITSNSHGVKHTEYVVMVPGRSHDSNPIDYQNIGDADNLQDNNPTVIPMLYPNNELGPTYGDIYKKKNSDKGYEAMVVAMNSETVFLGSGLEVSRKELMNGEEWEFLYNFLDK